MIHLFSRKRSNSRKNFEFLQAMIILQPEKYTDGMLLSLEQWKDILKKCKSSSIKNIALTVFEDCNKMRADQVICLLLEQIEAFSLNLVVTGGENWDQLIISASRLLSSDKHKVNIHFEPDGHLGYEELKQSLNKIAIPFLQKGIRAAVIIPYQTDMNQAKQHFSHRKRIGFISMFWYLFFK